MFVASPRHTHNLMSEQPNIRYSLPIPMVYENVRVEPAYWEYNVLTIDARVEALPDPARLSELIREGCLLVDIIDHGSTGTNSLLHYTFVRQIDKVHTYLLYR